jgi:hypothetical protein
MTFVGRTPDLPMCVQEFASCEVRADLVPESTSKQPRKTISSFLAQIMHRRHRHVARVADPSQKTNELRTLRSSPGECSS